MHDETQIRLVNPHAKRVGRHHPRQRPAHELILSRLPLRHFHTRMIASHFVSISPQSKGYFVHVLTSGSINDSALRPLLEQREDGIHFFFLILNLPYLEAQTRAVKTGDKSQRLL